MTTASLWILIFAADFYRPAAVIEQFRTKEDCIAAVAAVQGFERMSGPEGIGRQHPICIPVTAARPTPTKGPTP